MQRLTWVWHVALTQDVPKCTSGGADGILYGASRKGRFQLRLSSIVHEIDPAGESLQVLHDAPVCVCVKSAGTPLC